MKIYNLRSYLCLLLLLCGGLYSCQNQSELPPSGINYNTAKNRINQYTSIYGETEMQYLEGNNKKVILPRYFVVNSYDYSNLLSDRDGVLFASLNVKTRKDSPENPDTAVVNLIFHDLRPNPDGSLQNESDHFFDFCNACPIDCDNSYPDAGYDGGPVDHTKAIARINDYNHIYGEGEEIIRYMKNTETQDSVLIPRYYSFNVADIQGLLDAMNANDHQFFYVSMGAVPQIENGVTIPNTYISDLIFHYIRPSSSGQLESHQDEFFDVTRPCPDSCDDTEDEYASLPS